MKRFLFAAALVLAGATSSGAAIERDAKDIVRDAINHWRGTSSRGAMTMTIHRPDWERSMSMDTWTQGEKRSLVRVTAPRKDRGNGTLLDGNNMWSFSPRINRVIKVPSSLMSQSWMGSDFSNKDISRADDIVDQYDHTLLGESQIDAYVAYEIQAVPHEAAAVVWGKEVLLIRSDNILLEHRFYDQDDELVKALRTLKTGEMGGRSVAIWQRMEKADAADEWTEIVVDSVEFDLELSDNLFTLSNLRNPRD
jgi:outer membrane lipoprotein-sorting protein